MLVLARRPGERIIIDKDIVVTLLRIKEGKVLLGFEAPDCVSIVREEILDQQQPVPVVTQ